MADENAKSVSDSNQERPRRRASADTMDDLDEDIEPRGCAWLAPYVLIAFCIIWFAFFVYQNAEPMALSLFPYVVVKVRPPTLVVVCVLIGVALTVLLSWLRHRMRLEPKREGGELARRESGGGSGAD